MRLFIMGLWDFCSAARRVAVSAGDWPRGCISSGPVVYVEQLIMAATCAVCLLCSLLLCPAPAAAIPSLDGSGSTADPGDIPRPWYDHMTPTEKVWVVISVALALCCFLGCVAIGLKFSENSRRTVRLADFAASPPVNHAFLLIFTLERNAFRLSFTEESWNLCAQNRARASAVSKHAAPPPQLSSVFNTKFIIFGYRLHVAPPRTQSPLSRLCIVSAFRGEQTRQHSAFRRRVSFQWKNPDFLLKNPDFH